MASLQDSKPIPVVESIRRCLAWITGAALYGAIAWVLIASASVGVAAFDARPYLPWANAPFPRDAAILVVPSLGALPLLLVAHAHARRGRTMRSGRWFLWSLGVFTLLKVLPNGVYSPGWFLQPLLVVLVAVAYGAMHGLAMAALASLGLGACAWYQSTQVGQVDAIAFAAPVIGILGCGGLIGSLMHRVMQGLFAVETEQRERIEQTLRALRRRERLLRHAMRVATIGEMAGMVVHQLRNKFQLIHGHVALGLIADSAEKDRRLREIQSSVQAAGGAVEQLLTLAHPSEAVHHLVDLTSECRAFADRVRPLLPPTIRLETHFPTGAHLVNLAPEELGDALLNLVINAKQAMRQGTISIEVGAHDERAAYVAVADDGPGIDDRVRARLFTPFVTTKPRGHGTGLGLVAVDRFVRTVGGRIDVETEPGRGTRFQLLFPKVVVPQGARARVG
ncbi:MAG: HAMP domain-containing sensor histidine kinase [Planctomycetota bacterium]